MLTLGYLPLLEKVAQVTFSLQVEIVNAAISQLQCLAPERNTECQHTAPFFTCKTLPKLLSAHVQTLI